MRFGNKVAEFDNSVKEYKLSEEELEKYRQAEVKKPVKKRGDGDMAKQPKVIGYAKYKELEAKVEVLQKKLEETNKKEHGEVGCETEERKALQTCYYEVQRLENFISKKYSDEIGKGDPTTGESAVEVAIRLLKEQKEQIVEAAIEYEELDQERRKLLEKIAKSQQPPFDIENYLTDDMKQVIAERDALKQLVKVVYQ